MELSSVIDETNIKVSEYDKIVIGASVRYGKHNPKVYEFIRKHEKTIEKKPNAFFSVNVTARKLGKNLPENNPYVMKILKNISWQPKNVAVFAGKIDYQKYKMLDRLFIRLIMMITGGPTHPNSVSDFTDWKKVTSFGHLISEM